MTTILAPRPAAMGKAIAKAEAYQSVNPANGKIPKTFKELTDKQLETAINIAALWWRHTTFAEREIVTVKAAAIMRARGRQPTCRSAA